jgi:phenylpyruvate tautomerase PptA (4-oxalocrotonate tautomerase family)
MPFYTSITQEGTFSDEERAWVADQIMRIHTEVMEVPPAFVRTVFLTFPPGYGFTAGKAAASTNLTCLMRIGHPVEVKATLLRRLWAMYQEATGAPTEQLMIALQEIPASSAMELGKIMPDPGGDDAFMSAHG